MRYVLVIFSVISLTAGSPRIWGGQNASSGQFPYIVALNDYYSQHCGGVIIAPRWILTAGQCLSYLYPDASIYVGSHVNQVNGTAYAINHTIVHEGFDWTYHNDIGLIELDTDLVFGDTIQAIEFSEGVPPNATCTLAGWGASLDEASPDELKYADVTVIDMDLCQNVSADELWGQYLGPGQMCTLAPGGERTCFGDIGGPLVCDGKLAGIVSYNVGYSCYTPQPMPDVYTSITASLNWILAEIQP